MAYINPGKDFTIYSRSGCHFCTKVKRMLEIKSLNFSVVNCDEYILEDKASFLNYIKSLTEKEVKEFPMVFYNSEFIGGYNETRDYLNKLEAFRIDNNF